MVQKRLIELLSTLDKNELKQFGRFISSEFFNTNKSVVRLFKEIRRYYPEFDNKGMDKENLFKAVYDKRRFDDKTFRYLVTELSGLAEKYLVFILSEKEPVTEKLLLSEALLCRRLFTQAGRMLKIIEKDLAKENVFSVNLLTYKKELNILWNDLNIALDRQDPLIEKRTEQAEYLIYYSVIELSIMLNILVGMKKVYNMDYDETIVKPYFENIDYKAILNSLDNSEKSKPLPHGKEIPIRAFKAYLCYMITFLDRKDELYFSRLKELIASNKDIYSREELFNLYALLGSCCSLKREAIDDRKYLKEHFEAEKASLNAGLLTHSDEHYMQVHGYILLFNTSIELGEIDWAENFAAEYLDKLAPGLRDDIHKYTDSKILFERGEFEASLSVLNKVRFSIPALKLHVRELMLKIYYELDYFEEAFSLIDSFTHFLGSNKKLNPFNRNRYINFLDFTKKMLKARSESDHKIDPVIFKEDIKSCKAIIAGDWLLKKTDVLNN